MPLAKLTAINNEGIEFDLLTPFFRALLPAFEDRTDEIRIELVGSGLTISYGGKSASVPLDSPLYNYGVIAYSRILILSEMSIALEGAEQAGQFRVRYGKQLLPIHVKSRRDRNGWFLIFRPAWVKAEFAQ